MLCFSWQPANPDGAGGDGKEYFDESMKNRPNTRDGDEQQEGGDNTGRDAAGVNDDDMTEDYGYSENVPTRKRQRKNSSDHNEPDIIIIDGKGKGRGKGKPNKPKDPPAEKSQDEDEFPEPPKRKKTSDKEESVAGNSNIEEVDIQGDQQAEPGDDADVQAGEKAGAQAGEKADIQEDEQTGAQPSEKGAEGGTPGDGDANSEKRMTRAMRSASGSPKHTAVEGK